MGKTKYEGWFDDGLMASLCDRRGDPGACPPASNGFLSPDDGKTKCSNLMACTLCAQWANSGGKVKAGTKMDPTDPAAKKK